MSPSQFFEMLIAAVKTNAIVALFPAAITFFQAMQKAPPLTSPLLYDLYLNAQVAQLNSTWAQAAPLALQADQAAISGSIAAQLQAAYARASSQGSSSGAQAPAVAKPA